MFLSIAFPIFAEFIMQLGQWESSGYLCCLLFAIFNSSDQRDGMGREAGGGIGMGNTCTPMADSCQCMAKTTTIL